MAVNGSIYFVGDLRFGSRLGRRRALSGGSSASRRPHSAPLILATFKLSYPDGELPGCVAPHHASDQRLRHIGAAQARERIPGARRVVVRG
jgi:hypothetical protein